MSADVAAAVTGTILICEHVREDRGKWHILGLGWAMCPPGQQIIHSLATIQWPSQRGGVHDIKVQAQLWEGGVLEGDETGDAEPVAEVVVEAQVQVPEDTDRVLRPPVYHLHLPFSIEADLIPRRGYLLRLLVDGDPIAWDVFTTQADTEPDPDPEGDDDHERPDTSP